MRAWRIHVCPLDRECREYGAPRRIYFHTPKGSLIIGERSQVWTHREGYTDRSAYITWRPK